MSEYGLQVDVGGAGAPASWEVGDDSPGRSASTHPCVSQACPRGAVEVHLHVGGSEVPDPELCIDRPQCIQVDVDVTAQVRVMLA